MNDLDDESDEELGQDNQSMQVKRSTIYIPSENIKHLIFHAQANEGHVYTSNSTVKL